MRTRVLVVCRENVSRSPALAHLIRIEAERRGADVEIDSAGIRPATLNKLAPGMRTIFLKYGLLGEEVAAHKPKQISPEIIEKAHLVLTMSQAQRNELQKLFPEHARKIFTAREFCLTNEELMESIGKAPRLNTPDPKGLPMKYRIKSFSELNRLAGRIVGKIIKQRTLSE